MFKFCIVVTRYTNVQYVFCLAFICYLFHVLVTFPPVFVQYILLMSKITSGE